MMNYQLLPKNSSASQLKALHKPNKMDGYPLYPVKANIYVQDEEVELVSADTAQFKLSPHFFAHHSENELDFQDLQPGEDLDVPGGELNDANESTGNEDEENNYYSLGGDNHFDLDKNGPCNN